MRTLVIECATEACSAALFEHGALLAGDCRMLGRGHAEALVPMIAALPGRGKAGRIVVGLGPGSFTGLRVALSAAKALALAWKCELLGFPTLALLAAMARKAHGAQPLAVVTGGGHGEWFVAEFAANGLACRETASQRPEMAAAQVLADLVAGSQAEALVAARGFGTALPLWPDARAFPLLDPAVLTAAVRPLYGRAPDARLPAGAA
jgi:tRNA threonylcarbamoyladenosine biosynthesis protein TsaB